MIDRFECGDVIDAMDLEPGIRRAIFGAPICALLEKHVPTVNSKGHFVIDTVDRNKGTISMKWVPD